MPIYEYRCDNCQHEFETIQKVSEALLKTCPACQQDALRKKVSASGFRLKGGGWYETDFKSDKKRNVASGDKPAGESKDSGSSEKAAKDGGASKSDGGSGKSGEGKSGEGKSAEGAKSGGDKSASSGGTSKTKAAE